MKILSETRIQKLLVDVGDDIMPELIASVKEDIQRYIQELLRIRVDGNASEMRDAMTEIAFVSHSLKGVSRSFGLEALGEVGAHLETSSENYFTGDSKSQHAFCTEFCALQGSLDILRAKSMQALDNWWSAHNHSTHSA